MPGRIIEADRSLIVACDMKWDQFEPVVDATGDIDGISAYKVGFKIGLSGLSLPGAVKYIRENTGKKVIYDHQKAATDIPDTGKDFAETMEIAGVDAAILFPFTGPNVEEEWIKELQARDIGVIVGAEMTHPNIAATQRGLTKGYVHPKAFDRIFSQAIDLGVTNFVVPGNKPDRVAYYRALFESKLGEGNFDLYAPGFIAQGGSLSEAGAAAGRRLHGIVGRGIFGAADVRLAAIENSSQITEGAA